MHPRSRNPLYSPEETPASLEAFRYWVRFADFSTLPNITTFDSFDDCFAKLKTLKLVDVSHSMRAENKRRIQHSAEQYRNISRQILDFKAKRGGHPPALGGV